MQKPNSKGQMPYKFNKNFRKRKLINYDNYVYCLETLNNIIYTRRNGKSCWNGNSILGRPMYFDKTWTGSNTIQLIPNSEYTLDKMRGNDKLIYVKNITDTCIPGNSGWLSCKIEGMVSGNVDL